MTQTIRRVEDRDIVTSGSLVCPSPDRCDRQKALTKLETFAEYVHRHCQDHKLGEFHGATEDAVRNLGLNCFYFDHKYIYKNPTLTPYPFWEIHAFIAEWEWNEDDLEERVPIEKKTFKRIPDAADRRPGDFRQMKQMELPRQCEKTSCGSRAYPIFLSKREYFINGVTNYPILIRCCTSKPHARDSLRTILLRSTSLGSRINTLYGINLLRCLKCRSVSHVTRLAEQVCSSCGEKRRVRIKPISLIDTTTGAGGTSDNSVTFRWATDAKRIADDSDFDNPVFDPFAKMGEDEDVESEGDGDGGDDTAVYSIRAAGMRTQLTGARPRGYILDDITTSENSRTPEMRAQIEKTFSQATMQLEFGGWLLVNNTRKYTSDFAGKISVEPLRSQFHTLHRRVFWETGEPDDEPYVVSGYRYYYPVKGNGKRALDAAEVAKLEKRSDFPSEYLNDPTDPKTATFRREQFKIIDIHDEAMCQRMLGYQPIEIRYGLGCAVTPGEELELEAMKLRILAHNWWDPRGDEKESRRGDDDFGVGTRIGRYGELFVTWLCAGQFSATEIWHQVDVGNAYNRPIFNDYEMGVDERNVKPSFHKWIRDEAERTTVTPMIPMHFSHMPKSTKWGRCLRMETWTQNGDFYILSDAADAALIDKYIEQWIGMRPTGNVSGHDDGPDATSRGINYFLSGQYREPKKKEEIVEPALTTGIPLKVIMGHIAPSRVKSWGDKPL